MMKKMKAIYNCCFADPWVEVAKILKDKYNIEPVYWIGYDDDHSREIIPNLFPETIYHEYFDAWKGVFPNEIGRIANRYCIDIDFYNDISNYELQGLSLMDRMDADQRSFSYSERRNLFRKFLRYWMAIVDFYEIDIMISPVVPHRSFDYPLYLVCKKRGIKLLSFINTVFSNAGRIIAIDNLDSIPAKIKQDYRELLNDNSNFHLADDIVAYLENVRKKYEDAIPKSLVEHKRFYKKKPSVIQTVKKFLYDLSQRKALWFGKRGYLLNGVPTYCKQYKKDVEKSKIRHKLIPYSFRIYKRIRFLKSLEKEYSKITKEPDFDKLFAIFALHYQPEATSMPRGGIFYDQLYVIELLSKYLPQEWNIYIKENSIQFNPIAEGQTSRLIRFYKDAMKFPRISFVPVDADPFTLIDRAKVVITITGTIGWEAMVRKKPVICFGLSWCESFSDGVFRIRDTKGMGKIVDFIKNYKYSEQKLLSYLKAIEQNSICAYFRRGLKEKMNISETQCINELIDCVTKHFEVLSSAK